MHKILVKIDGIDCLLSVLEPAAGWTIVTSS
jgi:hypothetical protein